MDQIKFKYIGRLEVGQEHLWTFGYTSIWIDEDPNPSSELPPLEYGYYRVLCGLDDEYEAIDEYGLIQDQYFQEEFKQTKELKEYMSEKGVDKTIFITYKEFCDEWIDLTKESKKILLEKLGLDIIWIDNNSIEEWQGQQCHWNV